MLRAMLQLFTLQRLLVLLWAVAVSTPALAAKECELTQSCTTVAVTKVVVEGKIKEELAISLKEGLKSEVRQNDKLKIILDADNFTLDDLMQLNSCDQLTEECLNRIADNLKTDSLAFGTIRKVPGGYVVDMKWYSRKGNHTKSLWEREVANEVLKGDDERQFENNIPRLSFRLFGGDTGILIVSTNITGAEVHIKGGDYTKEGQLAGLTPFQNDSMLVDTYTVTVKQRGYLPVTQEVKINAGQRVELPIELISEDQGYGPASQALIISGWSVTGTGAAFLIAGLVTGIMTNSKQNEFDSKLVTADNLTFNDIDDARNIKDSGHTLADTTNVLLGVGGGLTIVGATLLLLGYTEVFDSPSSETDLRTTFYVDPNGGGGALVGFSF